MSHKEGNEIGLSTAEPGDCQSLKITNFYYLIFIFKTVPAWKLAASHTVKGALSGRLWFMTSLNCWPVVQNVKAQQHFRKHSGLKTWANGLRTQVGARNKSINYNERWFLIDNWFISQIVRFPYISNQLLKQSRCLRHNMWSVEKLLNKSWYFCFVPPNDQSLAHLGF